MGPVGMGWLILSTGRATSRDLSGRVGTPAVADRCPRLDQVSSFDHHGPHLAFCVASNGGPTARRITPVGPVRPPKRLTVVG
jgi:hypothetical protein